MCTSIRSGRPTEAAHAAARRRVLLLGAALAGLRTWTRAGPAAQPLLPGPVQALIDASGLPRASFGLHVQPVGRAGAPIASLNADVPFQMASTIKLVTALAALDLLGPDYRWRTQAFVDGAARQGRLLGDLVIAGGADVTLSAERLRDWFAGMLERGLREVWGDIVLDRQAFKLSEGDHVHTPAPAGDQPGYARPDALMLDAGVLRVGLQHAALPQPAWVRLSPRQAGLQVVRQLTYGTRCNATAQIEEGDGDSHLLVRGEWAASCGEREIAQLAVPHAELTRRAVAEIWRESGGRLKGRVRERSDAAPRSTGSSTADGAVPWATLVSPPLATLLHAMNKLSDNLVARTLFLSLAAGFPHRAASLPSARERVSRWLRAQGLGEGDIVVDNGAGLAHTEKGKPRALVRLLLEAWRGPHAQLFLESLPVAGVDGTLWRRMNQGPATGRAHLKTGSGIQTRALAGYVHCRSGRSFALAAFVNHAQAASAAPVLDAIVEWLAASG